VDPAAAVKERVRVFDLQTGNQFVTGISDIMGGRRYNDWWIDERTLATIKPAACRIEDEVVPIVGVNRRGN